MVLALYRRYRPDTFEGVIGQKQVTEPLSRALDEKKITHAYLFSGPRGCGKTSSARILARCINCEKGPTSHPCGECASCKELSTDGSGSLDVIEIDAASHNGVDDARELRERANFAPVRDRYKIFILDEAHMVTSQGFNALLKVVEEPPAHVIFIFATTEPEKVIGTIRSRTHHYPFRLVPQEVMLPFLENICQKEDIVAEKSVLRLVMRAGAGCVRDTLSTLDQLMIGAHNGTIDYDSAVALLGFTPDNLIVDFIQALIEADGKKAYELIQKVVVGGFSPRQFASDLLSRVRDLLLYRVAQGESLTALLGDMTPEENNILLEQSRSLPLNAIALCADILNSSLLRMKDSVARLELEVAAAKLLMACVSHEQTNETHYVTNQNSRQDSRNSQLPQVAHIPPHLSDTALHKEDTHGGNRDKIAIENNDNVPNRAVENMPSSAPVQTEGTSPLSNANKRNGAKVSNGNFSEKGVEGFTEINFEKSMSHQRENHPVSRTEDSRNSDSIESVSQQKTEPHTPQSFIAKNENTGSSSNYERQGDGETQLHKEIDGVYPPQISVGSEQKNNEKWRKVLDNLPPEVRYYVDLDKNKVHVVIGKGGRSEIYFQFYTLLDYYAFAFGVISSAEGLGQRKVSQIVREQVKKVFGSNAVIVPQDTTGDNEHVTPTKNLSKEQVKQLKQQISQRLNENFSQRENVHDNSTRTKSSSNSQSSRTQEEDGTHREIRTKSRRKKALEALESANFSHSRQSQSYQLSSSQSQGTQLQSSQLQSLHSQNLQSQSLQTPSQQTATQTAQSSSHQTVHNDDAKELNNSVNENSVEIKSGKLSHETESSVSSLEGKTARIEEKISDQDFFPQEPDPYYDEPIFYDGDPDFPPSPVDFVDGAPVNNPDKYKDFKTSSISNATSYSQNAANSKRSMGYYNDFAEDDGNDEKISVEKFAQLFQVKESIFFEANDPRNPLKKKK